MLRTLDTLPPLECPQDRLRQRLLTAYAFAFTAQFIGTMLLRARFESIEATSPIGAILVCAACLIGMVSAYFRWHMRLMGRLTWLFAGASVFYILSYQGGLTSYNVGTLLILPAVSALMLGSRDTAFFAIFIFGGLFGMMYFHDQFPAFSMAEADRVDATFRSMFLVSATIIASVFFLVRETEQTETRLRAALERHKFDATHDVLTGLPNRAAMNTFMSQVDSTRQPFDFYLLDLDGFKAMNDAFGHAIGDEVLIEVASRIAQHVPLDGFAARLGGDEFFLAIPQTEDTSAECDAFGADLADALCVTHAAGGQMRRATVSIGSARFPADGPTASVALSNADEALYAAKAAGKNQHMPFAAIISRHATRYG